MKKVLLPAFAAALLASCAGTTTTSEQPYEANWESLSQHEEIPEWLSDAKLGMYFTWGVYTVPAFGSEWYPYFITRPATASNYHRDYQHHIDTYGKDFEYHEFIPDFKAEHFDPKDWAKLFKSTGAKFAGPCAVHHDGFVMWDSEVNPWNAADMGPKRDVTGELLSAIKGEGLKTITTFHHARNMQRNADSPEEWAVQANGKSGRGDAGYNSHYGYNPNNSTAIKEGDLAKFYGNLPEEEFEQYWFDQIKEVVDQYSPDMIWFDSWLNLIPDENRQEMAAYYYNEAQKKGQDVTIGYKQKDMPLEVGILDIEQGGKKDLSERVWMTDITLSNNSWSYIEGQTYKKPELVLRNMIDVWSKNGVVLLNISPRSDGIIPDAQREVLGAIGKWLGKYGEAVYGTHAHDFYGFGSASTSDGTHGGQSATTEYTKDDIRFTVSKDEKSMYIFFLGRPTPGDVITIKDLGPHRYPTKTPVKRAVLLGTDIECDYSTNTNFAFVTIPDAPMDEMATVIKLELE